MIGSCGTLWQMVAEDQRAWHAGAGAWQGLQDINSRSIGVELVNSGAQPFSAPQMQRLEALLGALMQRWAIPADAVIGHSDMAPDRKEDPGPKFDWPLLARQGLAVWPEGLGPDVALAQSLDQIGYPPSDPEKRLQAFRFRFFPTATGPETTRDRRRAACVAATLRWV